MLWQVRRGLVSGRGALDAAPAAAAFSLTATANAVDTTSQTTYTFASQSFGTADSTRIIAVLLGARNAGGTQIGSSASFGGVSASQAVGQLAPSNAAVSEIWYAAVPTGTTGTVSITFAAANSRCSIQVYSIIAPSSAAPTATGASTANAGTTTFTIPAGGAAIGGSYHQAGGPGTPTATPNSPSNGFNNLDLNSNINGTQQTFAFHSNAGVITGSQTLTMTLTGASNATSTFATWGP
jgi:hypothetical protein